MLSSAGALNLTLRTELTVQMRCHLEAVHLAHESRVSEDPRVFGEPGPNINHQLLTVAGLGEPPAGLGM